MTQFPIDLDALAALAQVVLIDVTLAADNAVVVGLAVTGLAPRERRRAMLGGIAVATLLRVGFAFVAVQALAVVGLTLAGGLLLLWVAWKLFRETRAAHRGIAAQVGKAPKGTAATLFQIVLADVSMSLDNVLAVAGTAREHPWVLAAGLVLSVALMGVASALITKALKRLPWLSWIGLAIVTYAALSMIHAGWIEVRPHLA